MTSSNGVGVLRDLTQFRALEAASRHALRAELAARLAGFSITSESVGAAELPVFLHDATELRFAVVPGGELVMGLSEEDIESASEWVEWSRNVSQAVNPLERAARPVRTVSVAPFLCAVSTLSRADVVRLDPARRSDTFRADAARQFVHSLGFRLPSEAELEFMARDGRGLSFVYDCGQIWTEQKVWPKAGELGVLQLNAGEWAADDWHENYDAAPATSEPWRNGDPCGVYRGRLMISPDYPEELIYALAGCRGKGASDDDPDDDARFFSVRPTLTLALDR